jgi:lauroyl/myristoyl acyltransferase
MSDSITETIVAELGLRLASLVGLLLPPRLGYAAADFIADRIAARRDAGMVQAVRVNQWVVRGEKLEGKALDRAVRETIRHSARSIFDLHRALQRPRAVQKSIFFDAGARHVMERPEYGERGLVVASLHLGNFDLILHMLTLRGMKSIVLTIPDAQDGGHRMEYESRKRAGVKLLPASFDSYREALRHLQRGGLVATGIDRPIERPRIRPLFFGRPASVPLHHIILALRAKAPIMLLVTVRRPDGKHVITSSDLIEMDPHPDRETEVRRNAEKILRAAEAFIRKNPGQWTVPLPVWPEALAAVPK